MSDGRAGAGLLGGSPAAIAVGVDPLAAELEAQGVPVDRVSWRPPGGASEELERLAPLIGAIAQANDEAIARMNAAQPRLTGISTAARALGLERGSFLHAGPPVAWGDMAGPMQGAICGAAILEGLASDPESAARDAAAGRYELAPCHQHHAVGPMAGVISPSMPVWVVENASVGNRAHSTLNEGLGRVLRYGALDDEVLDRLQWMSDTLAPVIAEALAGLDEPIDLRALTAQALEMGDELHNRNRAATSLLIRRLLPPLLRLERAGEELSQVAAFLAGNDHFYLNLAMAMCKSIADAATGVDRSTVVTAMCRNGTTFGIRLSGTGDRWFTGPAGMVEGLYFPGYGPEDACPDLGDSAITETVGLGGFAMAAAPAIVSFVGGSVESARSTTRAMYEITWAESEAFRIPAEGFRGSPLGIDCREVVHTGILPQINTGIAHREAGVGQIGAGLVNPPASAFEDALRGFADQMGPWESVAAQ
jgi:hypothetical protein